MIGTETQQPSDEELIGRFLHNDTAAFDILYERNHRQLYAYLGRLVPGHADRIDDLFQRTWIKAINTLSTYSHNDRFMSWLLRIAHNLAVDLFRHSSSDMEETLLDGDRDHMEADDNTPWREFERKELIELVEAGLATLRPELREVFLLRQDDLSFKEIADIQACSVNTVIARMQYALRGLKLFLKGKL